MPAPPLMLPGHPGGQAARNAPPGRFWTPEGRPAVGFAEGRGLDIHAPLAVERIPGGVYFDDTMAVDMVMKRLSVADNYRRFFEEHWSRWHALYRQVVLRQRDGANYPSVEPFIVVETILPRIIRAIFSVDPPFKGKPVNPAADDQVDLVVALMDHQWDTTVDARTFLSEFSRYVLKYGTGLAKVVWSRDSVEDYVEIPEIGPYGPTGRIMGEVRQVKVNDSPKYVPVPLYDLWIEPMARNIQEAEYVIHRTWTPFTVLQRLERAKVYRNTADILRLRDAGDSSIGAEAQYRGPSGYGQDGRDYKLKRSGRYSPFDYQDTFSPLVEVVEYWGTIYGRDREGNLVSIPNQLVTIADRKVLLRRGNNPYAHGKKPFVACSAHEDEDEFYGVGFIEILEPTAQGHQAFVNLSIDNLVNNVNTQFLVGKGARLPYNSIRPKPHGIIPVNDINQIRLLDRQDLIPSAHIFRTWLEQKGKVVTGTTDFVRAEGGDAGGDTATEVVQSIRQSNIRFDKLLFNFKGAVRQLLCFQHALNKQFLESPQIIRMQGADSGFIWRQITGRDIGGEVDFVLMGDDAIANDQALQQRTMMVMENLLGDPVIRQSVNMRRVLKRMFDIFRIPHSDEFLLDTDTFGALAYLSQDPHDEFFRALNGQPMQVMPKEDDDYHIAIHQEQWEMVAHPPFNAPHLRPMLEQHQIEHEMSKRRKAQQENAPGGGMIPGAGGPMGAQGFPGQPGMGGNGVPRIAGQVAGAPATPGGVAPWRSAV